MNPHIQELEERNPDALLLEPRELFDRAVVGVTDEPDDHWDREPGHLVAVYDFDEIIRILVEEEGQDAETAAEFFYYNIGGAWRGNGTPTFWEREIPD